jgi:fibronectin type 3 domain-containing protein
MPAGDYKYEVTAVSDRFGESPVAATVNFTLVHPVVGTPGNLTHTIANGNDFTLTWTSVPYGNSYKVYQIVNGQRTLISTGAALSKAFPNMPAGDYKYEVTAVSDRFGESPVAATVSFTLVHPVVQAPGNLKHTIANGNDFTLTWTSVPYGNSYKVYQIIDGQRVLKSTGTTLSKAFPNMPAGDHQFEVTAVSDRFGESVGAPLSFTLTHPVVPAPANLTKTIVNLNDIKLTWQAAQWANSYKIYQVIDGQKVFKESLTTLTKTYLKVHRLPSRSVKPICCHQQT